jgi:hypothetical protein
MQPNYKKALLFIVVGSLSIIGFGASVLFLNARSLAGFVGPQVMVPLLLVLGLGALLVALACLTSVFRALNLSDRTLALGLPEGSVRAVIALSLILIFVIMAMTSFDQMQVVTTSLGFPEERLPDVLDKLLSAEQVLTPEGTSVLRVRLLTAAPPETVDLAKQMMTTISTLVVAVAGFYFGTRAAQGATEQATQPTVQIITPPGGTAKIDKAKTPLTIRLGTNPSGLAVHATVVGDTPDSLKQDSSTEYTYAPKTPSPEVRVRFSLVNDATVFQDLLLTFDS